MRASFLLCGLAALALLVGCGRKAAPPTLFQWEDYADPPFLAGYIKAYGEKPNVVPFADEDEAFAKMQRGFKPDVMGPCYYEFPRWKEAGLLQPIDTAKLKNWNKLSPTLRHLPGIDAGGGKVWFVPHYWGNTSLTVRTDLAPDYAKSQSWDILFDPKYKGRVSVLDGVDDTVPFIARMAGVDAYHMSGTDWLKVQAKLKALMPQLKASVSPAIDINLAVDCSKTIRASLRDVEITLFIAVALVILVVFAFLRNARATLIPVAAVTVRSDAASATSDTSETRNTRWFLATMTAPCPYDEPRRGWNRSQGVSAAPRADLTGSCRL